MIAVARGDDPRLFGPGGRVRAARLFPLPASYVPGLRVLSGGRQADELYDELGELLARPDALDPSSETGQRIARIEDELSRIEAEEAAELGAALDTTLLLPPRAGEELDQKIAEVLHAANDRAGDDPAAGDS